MQLPGFDFDSEDQALSPPIHEIFLIAATVTVAICSALWSFKVAESGASHAVTIGGIPVALALLALATRFSQLVDAAISVSLIVGLSGLFSIGFPILIMGIFLTSWFVVRSHMVNRDGDRWLGHVYFNIWHTLAITLFLILVGLTQGR